MAALWEGDISARTMSRALAKVGWTRKKKTYDYREQDAARQVAFQAQLAAIPSFQRVMSMRRAWMNVTTMGTVSASGVSNLRHCGRGAEPDEST
jgi:hypothetical protein